MLTAFRAKQSGKNLGTKLPGMLDPAVSALRANHPHKGAALAVRLLHCDAVVPVDSVGCWQRRSWYARVHIPVAAASSGERTRLQP
jgi:hypothetical protein